MTSLNSDEVRIPRRAREAVARHEQVLVFNRERPVFAIVHPDDVAPPSRTRRGRAVSEIAAALAGVAPPDPGFESDMEDVLRSVGAMPGSPWER